MNEHNVLYIVEGDSEYKLLGKLWNRFGQKKDYKVYRYETNIHSLMDVLFTDGRLDTDLDLLRVLRTTVKNDTEGVLNRKYEYVYMIFDLEPHDTKMNLEKVSEMIEFFDDPADNGKLYINYPMLESYRHLKSTEDESYLDRKVDLDFLKNNSYKQLVDMECGKELKQLNNYDKEMFEKIIRLNIRKENRILTGNREMMTKEGFLKLTGTELFAKQRESMEKENSLFVINTCIFAIVDYRPSMFFG